MHIHPLFQNPNSVLISYIPLDGPPAWEDFRRAALQALTILEVDLEAGEKVAVKPNNTSGEHFADPDNGITTHPGFVHGMLDYFAAQSLLPKRFTVIEDPRNSNDNQPRHWRGTGFDRLARETGIRLHSPTTYNCVKLPVPNPHTHPVLNVSRLAVAPGTLLINAPKLKTHNLGITTLCMKNLMGLVNVFDRHYCGQAWQEMPEPWRSDPRPRQEWLTPEIHLQWQEGLARRLVDTAQVIHPALNLVEGVVAREGTGFQRGRNRLLGLVIAGVNLVAVDSLASYLMGFDPLRLPYIRMAAQAGLGPVEIFSLQVYTTTGDHIQLCQDTSSLRIQPPMQVISNLLGEDPHPFEKAVDVTDQKLSQLPV